MDERTIYILLTRSGTWFSRLIHFATQDSYTHASIGLDGPDGPFYSFARKYRYLALPIRAESQPKGLSPPAAKAAIHVRPAGGLPLQRAGSICLLFQPVPSAAAPLLLFSICSWFTGGLRCVRTAQAPYPAAPGGFLRR